MLQSHSFLWHYLWLAPNLLQASLAVLLWRRGLQRLSPVFFAYLIFGAIEQFILYGMDVLPSVSAEAFWSTSVVGVAAEAILVVGMIGELSHSFLRGRPAIAKVGSPLIGGAGAILVLLAVAAAAYAPILYRQPGMSRAYLLTARGFGITQGS